MTAPQHHKLRLSHRHVHHTIVVPRGVLMASALLILSALLAVLLFRLSGQEPVAQVPEPTATVVSRVLRFEDRPDGAVEVIEVTAGGERTIRRLDNQTDGFIRGVLRSMARARRASGIGPEPAFVLSLQRDGRLILEDPATGQRIDLRAFGTTNADSFRGLLDDDGALR